MHPGVFHRDGRGRALSSLRRPSFVLAGVLAALVLGGCAAGRAPVCRPLPPLAASAADSLGLEDFLLLPAAERAQRRADAATYAVAGASAPELRSRLQALNRAAGLAPDEPELWLSLAALLRWTGGGLEAQECLDRAAAALVARSGPEAFDPLPRTTRDAAALHTALLRAWLHYDRAQWREGLSWADAASGLAPGDRNVLCIRGLLAAALGRHSQASDLAGDLRRSDMFATEPEWILAVLDRARGQAASAFALIIKSSPRGEDVTELRPAGDHVAECYRDMGIIAERVGQWSWARRWYAASRAAVPVGRSDCLREVRARRLGPPGRAPELPVWLAFDRHYATGSLSAYVTLALARHDAAEDPAERAFWAGAAVDAAGIVLRREDDRAWALRARGLVFAARGDDDRALADLRRAASALAQEGVQDAALEAALGHVLLKRRDHASAMGHLRRAVGLEPGLAAAWSDLGLALVMAGETSAAAEAFARALDLDPALATAWYNRGLMHVHAGDLDAAAADLAEAARLAPDNSDIARLLQQLEIRRRQAGETVH